MNLAHRIALLGRRVDHREIQLHIRCVQFNKEIEDEVEHLVWAGVFAIDLVDHDDWLGAVLECFLEHKLGLRLWAVEGVHDQQHAVDHLHDALDLAAEVGMAGSINDVDVIVVPAECCVLGADRDALFPLQIHGIHDPFLRSLGFVGSKGSGLFQKLVNESGLAMVDVCDDGDIANVFHVSFLDGGGQGARNMGGVGAGVNRRCETEKLLRNWRSREESGARF